MRFVIDRVTQRIKGAFPDITFPINGNFIVKVPDMVSVSVTSTTTLTDLLTGRMNGILAYYPSFANIITDDLLDSSGIEKPLTPDATIFKASCGDSSNFSPFSTSLLPKEVIVSPPSTNYGTIQSITVDITSPPPTTDVIVLWNLFQLALNETAVSPIAGVYYSELSPDSITCQVSLDGGSNWEQVYNNTFTSLVNTGHDVKIKFINDHPTYEDQRVWVESYAILYT